MRIRSLRDVNLFLDKTAENINEISGATVSGNTIVQPSEKTPTKPVGMTEVAKANTQAKEYNKKSGTAKEYDSYNKLSMATQNAVNNVEESKPTETLGGSNITSAASAGMGYGDQTQVKSTYANTASAMGPLGSGFTNSDASTSANTSKGGPFETGKMGEGTKVDTLNSANNVLSTIIKHKDLRAKDNPNNGMLHDILKIKANEAIMAGDMDKVIELATASNAIDTAEEMAEIMDKEASLARSYINSEQGLIDKQATADLTEMLLERMDKTAADKKRAEDKGAKKEKATEQRGQAPGGRGDHRNPTPVRAGKPADGECREDSETSASNTSITNKGVTGEKSVEGRASGYQYSIVRTPSGYAVVPIQGRGSHRNPVPQRQGAPVSGVCRYDTVATYSDTARYIDKIAPRVNDKRSGMWSSIGKGLTSVQAKGALSSAGLGTLAGSAAALAPEIDREGAGWDMYNMAVRNPITTGLAVGSLGALAGSHMINPGTIVNPEKQQAIKMWRNTLTRGSNAPTAGKAASELAKLVKIADRIPSIAGTQNLKDLRYIVTPTLAGLSIGGALVNEYNRKNSYVKDLVGGTNRTILAQSDPGAASQRSNFYNPYARAAIGALGGAGLSAIGQQLATGSINPMDVAAMGLAGGLIGGGSAYLGNYTNVDYDKVKRDRSQPVI